MTTALEWGEGSASRPGRSLPPGGKTRYPLYRTLGGPQGRSGQVRKISPPLVFDPRTVQPVASRYIDYATRPTAWSLQVGKSRCIAAIRWVISKRMCVFPSPIITLRRSSNGMCERFHKQLSCLTSGLRTRKTSLLQHVHIPPLKGRS